MEEGEGSIRIDKGFNIVGAESTDSDATKLLRDSLLILEKGVDIIIGERGDKVIDKYSSLIPKKEEGYYILIDRGEVVIAGNDERGTYYGVQSFLQIAKGERVGEVAITDYPSVPERGMVEGYYGNPLSYEDRVSQFRFYGENKMNVYIYGPKDDPYHGFSNKWREPYPQKKAEEIGSLVEEAKRNKVRFVWAIHPGLNIKWNRTDSVATIKKFDMMYELGVRDFAIFFDDIPRSEANQGVKQANYLNYLQKEFVAKREGVSPLILCPTVYNQAWDKGDYLAELSENLSPEVRVMWTGKIVCSMIDKATMEYVNGKIKRKAYIWLNYPVTDYAIDHLAMGPFVGNSTDIANDLSGFVANPMEYGEASKVALFGVAAYSWNMTNYNSTKVWEEAMRRLMPNNYEAFRLFCENNIDVGASYFNLRMDNESAPFAKSAEWFMESYKVNSYNEELSSELRNHFNTFTATADTLLNSNDNPSLLKEITPWLHSFKLVAQKGEILLDMQKNLSVGDTIAFVSNYRKVRDIEQKQEGVRSRDFEGSIKVANSKAANEVVAPFLAALKKDMIKYYRENFDYCKEEFPTTLLEDGNYYIMVGKKYLYNGKGSKKPTLRAGIDDTNPQRVVWRVVADPMTQSYKITSEQDGRYLNSDFGFGTMEYNIFRHAHILTSAKGGLTIKNSKVAGGKTMIERGGSISPLKDNEIVKAALFNFISVE